MPLAFNYRSNCSLGFQFLNMLNFFTQGIKQQRDEKSGKFYIVHSVEFQKNTALGTFVIDNNGDKLE